MSELKKCVKAKNFRTVLTLIAAHLARANDIYRIIEWMDSKDRVSRRQITTILEDLEERDKGFAGSITRAADALEGLANSGPQLFVPGKCEPEEGQKFLWACRECDGLDFPEWTSDSAWFPDCDSQKKCRSMHEIWWFYAPEVPA